MFSRALGRWERQVDPNPAGPLLFKSLDQVWNSWMLYNTFLSTFHTFPHANNQEESLLLGYTLRHQCSLPEMFVQSSHIFKSMFFVAHLSKACKHTHMRSTHMHRMQYGKRITTGLILETAHRQGELQSTGEENVNVSAINKEHYYISH